MTSWERGAQIRHSWRDLSSPIFSTIFFQQPSSPKLQPDSTPAGSPVLCQSHSNPLSFLGGKQISPCACGIIRKGRHQMAIAVGQTAPDFTLKNQYDKEVKLSDF